ncbi:TPA: hypothetical protein HA361_06885 [Candidatus Woesearchaeota archaeon]|nr:hypothetical protein [Candidatus Woesearchaeota archaeon]HII69169.1 hypothetical protein [Candidatus Woesearchaeota archaeon]
MKVLWRRKDSGLCKQCGRRMVHDFWGSGVEESSGMKGYCYVCARQITSETEEKRRDSLSPNEKQIEEEIEKLESGSGVVVVLVILGVIGLFFFCQVLFYL